MFCRRFSLCWTIVLPPTGKTGHLMKTDFFDMWAGGEYFCVIFQLKLKGFWAHMHHAVYCGADVAPLIKFLKEIEDGTIVMMAAFDDPATKYFFFFFCPCTMYFLSCLSHIASCYLSRVLHCCSRGQLFISLSLCSADSTMKPGV